MAGLAAFNRVEIKDVAVPAATTKAAPLQTDISFRPGAVVGLEIVIPDGHEGLTGIALAQAHQPIIPMTAGAFIVGNDEKIEWPMVGTIDTGNWQAFTYNTDVFVHTFHVRFLVDDFAVVDVVGGLAPALVLPSGGA